MYVPFQVTATAAKIGGSLSCETADSATTATGRFSVVMGIYTLNGSTLSLASSGSANNSFVWSHSDSTTGNTSVNSMRQLTVPMNVSMTPGEYWLAVLISSATTYTSAGFTIYGGGGMADGATVPSFADLGSGTASSKMVIPYQGIYTAATAAMPASIGTAGINWTSASNVARANFYGALYNAAY
jgi:hypothetical protein